MSDTSNRRHRPHHPFRYFTGSGAVRSCSGCSWFNGFLNQFFLLWEFWKFLSSSKGLVLRDFPFQKLSQESLAREAFGVIGAWRSFWEQIIIEQINCEQWAKDLKQ